ncbi:MAG: hypothetical protein H0W83_15040, partial [Planctomycetes bacterium]|nr:hypothetical protein [Planctomycetota bacterium]
MIRIALACVVLIAASFMSVHAADVAAAATLDGRSFDVVCKGPDQTKDEKDSLVFTATEGDSTACHQYGFGKGPVTYRAKDGGVEFSFSTKSEKEGTIAWNGIVKGDKVSGKMAWTKDGKTTSSDFAGSASPA